MSNKREIVLCDIQSGNRQMTTWLDKNPKLAVGVKITLADYDKDTVWEVKAMYEGSVHYWNDFDFHRKWDNNNYDKHEGLGINP